MAWGPASLQALGGAKTQRLRSRDVQKGRRRNEESNKRRAKWERQRDRRRHLGFELQQRGSGAILALCPMVPLKRDRTLWRYL